MYIFQIPVPSEDSMIAAFASQVGGLQEECSPAHIRRHLVMTLLDDDKDTSDFCYVSA